MAADARRLTRELEQLIADERLSAVGAHRVVLDRADVRALLAEIDRVREDNALLRQKLEIAWQEVLR